MYRQIRGFIRNVGRRIRDNSYIVCKLVIATAIVKYTLDILPSIV